MNNLNDDNASAMPERMKKRLAERQLIGLPPPDMTRDEFLAWRCPREVSDNPTRMDNPVWQWLVRTGWDAERANEIFGGPSSADAGPMWCFDRMGKTETLLADGRIVHVSGEYEDFYHPEFYIYNDVTVIDPGGAISIFGYPRTIFPPTDFHTATLVGNAIIIVGGLGYSGQRTADTTPVYKLDLHTFSMSRVTTSGQNPGWIHDHTVELLDNGQTLVLRGGEVWPNNWAMAENIDCWALDLETSCWTRLTKRDWQRWAMVRTDNKQNRLRDTRSEAWHRTRNWSGSDSDWKHDAEPDLEALASLYRIDETVSTPETSDESNVYRIFIDGILVRFTEDMYAVCAMVEGRLSPERLSALQQHTLEMLKRIDKADYKIIDQ